MKIKNIIALLPLTTISLIAISTPISSPLDHKIVSFQYHPHKNYIILTKPNSVTNLLLSPNEEVELLALGDTIQWKVVNSKNHVFIKPLKENLITSATLVSNQRVYQIELRSSPENGKWYQQVSWKSQDIFPLVLQGRSKQSKTKMEIENLDFDYKIEGDAPFRPKRVFNDGKFTWIKFSENNQELPAIFQVNQGKLEITNYIIKNKHLMIPGLPNTLVLKIDNRQVTLYRKNKSYSQKNSFNGTW